MFITREAYKSPVSVFLSGIGDLGWSATEVALQQVWFLVHLEEIETDDDVGYTSVRTIVWSTSSRQAKAVDFVSSQFIS